MRGRPWLPVVAIVAAGTTGVVYLRRRHRSASPAPVRVAGRTARSLRVARIGATAGGRYGLHRARRAFVSAERRDQLDVAFQLHTAEQVTEVLGGMKGALMKLGQLASYLDQGLPEPVRQALAQLQADAPAMDPDLATATVEAELGGPVGELFEELDPKPLAAASIGQVHRAITADGTAVAVKVQYPGVDEAIRADLDNAGLLFAAVGMMFPGLQPGPIVEELRARLSEELDYVTEAANQRLFADYYRDHPFIHIPEVIDGYSTARVLTTELAEGERFDAIRSWPDDERNLAAEAMYRFVFGSLYRMHAFNGDPHPGNYLFRPGGQVTFLDFGLVKHFTDADIAHLRALVQAIVLDPDMPAFRRAVADAGFLPLDAPFSDADIENYFGHFYAWLQEDAPKTITPEWSSESVRRFFDTTGPHGEIMRAANVPPSFVIIQRINLGLGAVIGDLRATRNWRRIWEELWPWIDGPPSTPLGEAEAEWRRRRDQ